MKQPKVYWEKSQSVWPGTIYAVYPDQEEIENGLCDFWDKVPEKTFDNNVQVPICVRDSKLGREYYLNNPFLLAACVTALLMNRPEGMVVIV